ncbi:MAG: UTP--glucose-1-phosphate uridylyltransferase GalU [Pseudomonadota bacterium]
MTNKNQKPIRKAVFPVAGLGTRFLPATKIMPKEMLPIGDRPLIQHVVEEAQEAGIEEFIFVTGRQKEMLEEHFDYQPELMDTLKARGKDDMLEKVRSSQMREGKLFTTRQAKPLGLGHAIWCARKLVGDEPFAILLPDVLMKGDVGCLKQMVNVYNHLGGNIIALEDVPKEEVYKYGIIETGTKKNGATEIKSLVEKPAIDKAPSTLSVVGRYILQPDVFEYLSSFEKGAGNEIQLTDAMAKLIGEQPFHGIEFEGKSYDCGSRLGFVQANIAYGLDSNDIADPLKKSLKKFIES